MRNDLANAIPQYGAGQASQAPARLSQVQQEMERSAALLEELEKHIGVLFERLKPVVRQDAPETSNKDAAVKPVLVGHAMALCNQNDQLHKYCYALSELIGRLEL